MIGRAGPDDAESKGFITSEGIVQVFEEGQRKTVTRTFRIYEDLGIAFDKLASKLYTTQTNLMNEILKQYLYWAQYIVNHESPFLTFSSGTVVSFAETLDDEKLEKIVKEVSIEDAADFIKFRWKKVNFKNIIQYLDLLSAYANIGSITVSQLIENDNASSKKESSPYANLKTYEVAVRHHLGRRWSTFLAIYIANLFSTLIKETETRYEVSSKSCFVYVKMAQSVK